MIRCILCPREIAEIEDAIDAGWIPSFFDGPEEIYFPACGECVAQKMLYAGDGETEIRPEFRAELLDANGNRPNPIGART